MDGCITSPFVYDDRACAPSADGSDCFELPHLVNRQPSVDYFEECRKMWLELQLIVRQKTVLEAQKNALESKLHIGAPVPLTAACEPRALSQINSFNDNSSIADVERKRALVSHDSGISGTSSQSSDSSEEDDGLGADNQSTEDEGHLKKRRRRTYAELNRKFVCPFGSCKRCYASEGSLNQHLKIKHGGGTVRSRTVIVPATTLVHTPPASPPGVPGGAPGVHMSVVQMQVQQRFPYSSLRSMMPSVDLGDHVTPAMGSLADMQSAMGHIDMELPSTMQENEPLFAALGETFAACDASMGGGARAGSNMLGGGGGHDVLQRMSVHKHVQSVSGDSASDDLARMYAALVSDGGPSFPVVTAQHMQPYSAQQTQHMHSSFAVLAPTMTTTRLLQQQRELQSFVASSSAASTTLKATNGGRHKAVGSAAPMNILPRRFEPSLDAHGKQVNGLGSAVLHENLALVFGSGEM
eukprot:Opistho-2@11314